MLEDLLPDYWREVKFLLDYDELYSTETCHLRKMMLYGTYFKCFKLKSKVRDLLVQHFFQLKG